MLQNKKGKVIELKYTRNQRMTKAIKEMAKQRRGEMFKDMTVEEICAEVPIANAYLYEFESRGVGVFVPDCPICGSTHLHGAGSALNGLRSPFCLITDEPIPNNYKLQLDMGDPDNVRLAKKYELPLGEMYEATKM